MNYQNKEIWKIIVPLDKKSNKLVYFSMLSIDTPTVSQMIKILSCKDLIRTCSSEDKKAAIKVLTFVEGNVEFEEGVRTLLSSYIFPQTVKVLTYWQAYDAKRSLNYL